MKLKKKLFKFSGNGETKLDKVKCGMTNSKRAENFKIVNFVVQLKSELNISKVGQLLNVGRQIVSGQNIF